MSPVFALALALWLAAPAGPAASPPTATTPAAPTPPASAGAENAARDHYKTGLELFGSGDKAQALIEFTIANELAPRPENVFMIAHCEYHLGQFKQARAHYQEFLAHESKGTLGETARQRIDAITRRQGVLVIQAAPLGVDITLERLDMPAEPLFGQAPNQFSVPAGRWRVTAKKTNYRTQSTEVVVDSVDTIPMFFPLERQPAHLEISTDPDNATLYVRGNRARNPYVQDVEPGAYEIYAEAPSYESRTETYILNSGEPRKIKFPLRYVKRSGKPELIGFWTAAGAVAAAGAVLARLNSVEDKSVPASATVMGGAAMVGGVLGALVSTAAVPDYLPDNRALFRIGAAWIGAAEGATTALVLRPSLAAAWAGGAVGLATGALAGTFLERKAPNYGRVAIIQSGAATGLLAGALMVPALGLDEGQQRSVALLGGLNLGLATGLVLSYFPDQSAYGPTWQHVMLVDLATGAGTIAGALIKTVSRCLQSTETCSFETNQPEERQLTARFALIGGGLGLLAGWLLTWDYDRNNSAPLERSPVSFLPSFLPMPALLPVTSSDGATRMAPGLVGLGSF